MAIEKKEVEIAAQVNDVMELLVEVIKVVKNKGSYTELLDEFIEAINGADEIPAEMKNLPVFVNTIGGNLGNVIDAFSKQD